MNGITRQLGFIAVMVAVPVICWYFVFTPQNEMIDSIQEDIRQRQQKLDEVETLASNLEDLESIVESGLQAIELIESKLPRQQDVERILEQVRLESTEEDLVDEDIVRRFEITCALVADADVRTDAGRWTPAHDMLERMRTNEVNW